MTHPTTRLIVLLTVLALIAAACSNDSAEQASSADESEQVEPEVEALDATTTSTTSPTTTASTTTSTTTTTVPPTTTTQRDFSGTEIEVVVFDNPTMDLITDLTPEFFTGPTGIDVEFINFDEVRVSARELVNVDAIARPNSDVIMLSPFESSQFGANGWLHDSSDLVDREEDESFDVESFIPSVVRVNSAEVTPQLRPNTVETELFAVPFYAESSIIMYNQQIIDEAGITFPEQPTWQQVANIARQLHTDEVTGICMRGIPEWDELGAALTTVVNTFGGTWWEFDETREYGNVGEPQINQPDSGFRAATDFYLNLASDAGPDNFAETGFDQCLEQFQNGDAAIWYDSTAAPALLEALNSPIAGNVGYARAPIAQTEASGALFTWGLASWRGAQSPEAGGEFIRWATSPDTIQLLAEHSPDGWSDPAVIGAATRTSHFDIPELRAAAEPYGDIVLDELNAADPNNPGTTQRPGTPGIQYVGIPEFQQIATDCTVEFSAAVQGSITIDQALNTCQVTASEVSR